MGMMVNVVDFLLVGFLLTGVLIETSKSQRINSTLQASEPKCLTYLDEIKLVLGSTRPPISDSKMTDNYFNISRALYPSINLPALYVKVTIQFLKEYQDGTKLIDKTTKKFTWSKACSYVSVNHISLVAMSIFSLGTIFPQRRKTELTITVPPLCKSSPYASDEETTWRYVVSTLEDIAVNSKISDPRINTVACVVQGHEGDRDQPIKYPKNNGPKENVVVWDYCWLTFTATIVTSFEMWSYLHKWLKDAMANEENKPRIVAGTILKMTVIIFIITLCVSLTCFIVAGININYPYTIAYLVAVAFFSIIGLIINGAKTKCQITNRYCICNGRRNCNCIVNCICCCCCYILGFWILFPCLFMSVHHVLWVLCGILSEPYWAIPIFLMECLLAFSIMYCLYLYERDVVVRKRAKGKKLIIFHLFLCFAAFSLILFMVLFVGHGHIVDVTNTGVIEVVITLTFMWLIKTSGLNLKSFASEQTANVQTAEREMQEPLNNAQPETQ